MRGPAFSVLSEFRSRLVAGGMEAALLEVLLARLGELGLVGAGMRQRTDSTHVLGRIRELNRLELAGETVRAALEALAAAAPGWLAGVIDGSWQEVYGQRVDDFRLPDSTARRADLAVRYGRDGYHLLRQVHRPGAPGGRPRAASASCTGSVICASVTGARVVSVLVIRFGAGRRPAASGVWQVSDRCTLYPRHPWPRFSAYRASRSYGETRRDLAGGRPCSSPRQITFSPSR